MHFCIKVVISWENSGQTNSGYLLYCVTFCKVRTPVKLHALVAHVRFEFEVVDKL
jgi:hypothetical protein